MTIRKDREMKAIICFFLIFSATGCATILQPGPDKIKVDTNPKGARVFLDGQEVGVTPCVVLVERSAEGEFRIELEGYKTRIIKRHKVMSGWVLGNAVFLLGAPIVVDLITHNQGHYPEDPIYTSLRPDGNRQPSSEKKK